MKRILTYALAICLIWAATAAAVPETISVRVTDVTTSSFAVVWMTDVAATPNVEVYGDSAMANPLAGSVTIVPTPDAPQDIAAAATRKGIMKVRVAGLSPNTTYYVRSVTADPADPTSIGYSPLQQVTTAATVVPYRTATDGTLQGAGNDLVSFTVYIRPSDADAVPGQGDLILLETTTSPYPLSAFVGVGTTAPEGIIDLNNLFGPDMTSLAIAGGEKAQLSIYRGGSLSTLIHYRRLPVNSTTVAASQPVKGFFADINLDGNVDDQDFAEFRKQYRTQPNDVTHNPDYNFDEDLAGVIDAQDFARFAREYGRGGVQ